MVNQSDSAENGGGKDCKGRGITRCTCVARYYWLSRWLKFSFQDIESWPLECYV